MKTRKNIVLNLEIAEVTIRQLRRALKAYIAITLTCFCSLVWGSEIKPVDHVIISNQTMTGFETSTFMQQIKDIHTARIATVILVPPSLIFERVLTEGTLKEYGCTFATSDRLLINRLIDILHKSNIDADIRLGLREPAPYEMILLTLGDGSEAKFLFGQRNYRSGLIFGAFYKNLESKEQRIKAKGSLPRDLFHWAINTGVPIAKPSEYPEWCQDFLNNPAWK